MAIGLSKKRVRPQRLLLPVAKPTLEPSEVFLLLEVSFDASMDINSDAEGKEGIKKKKSVAWCRSLENLFYDGILMYRPFSSDDKDDEADEPIKFDNFKCRALVPYYRVFQQIDCRAFGHHVCRHVIQGMEISLRLFRADTGNSFVWCQEQAQPANVKDNGLNALYEFGVNQKPLAPTKDGSSAREMCFTLNINHMIIETSISISASLPQRGSPDEPEWLNAIRNNGRYSFLTSTIEEYSTFLTTEFECQFNSVRSVFLFNDDDELSFDCDCDDYKDKLMLFLQGLDWE